MAHWHRLPARLWAVLQGCGSNRRRERGEGSREGGRGGGESEEEVSRGRKEEKEDKGREWTEGEKEEVLGFG